MTPQRLHSVLAPHLRCLIAASMCSRSKSIFQEFLLDSLPPLLHALVVTLLVGHVAGLVRFTFHLSIAIALGFGSLAILFGLLCSKCISSLSWRLGILLGTSRGLFTNPRGAGGLTPLALLSSSRSASSLQINGLAQQTSMSIELPSRSVWLMKHTLNVDGFPASCSSILWPKERSLSTMLASPP